ncbi:hypothetical protein LOTGIDRAFT_160197 [Lottia gigantea]|uniref:WAP domain-containing protein n=1 Tax=Lottia gigantea TaxID=225164 RepID=V4ALL1_LOTGI|nr:hypothetical protein LOTGIDRAFT_160197 [Lottia gigantea]ESO95650.1 hypothetical protein LOTGIDRAFT_160197 [Lottia gigantea]
MMKPLIITVFISCLIQVSTQTSYSYTEGPQPTPPELPPYRINPYDEVTDPNKLPCANSKECPAGYSCRDSNGNIKYNQEGPWGYIKPNGPPGNCGSAAKPGEVCVNNNDCPKGYDCYKEVTGVCCSPSYCVTTEYAQYRSAYWSNCSPPHCYFPAK